MISVPIALAMRYGNPSIHSGIKELVDKFEISLKSENLVKNVFVDIGSKHNFSDNYLHVSDAIFMKKTIKILGRGELKSKIKLLSLYDTY